jgi:hypothetical protein
MKMSTQLHRKGCDSFTGYVRTVEIQRELFLSYFYPSTQFFPSFIFSYFYLHLSRSRGSSGSIVSDYGLDDRGSILDRYRGFFF